LPLAASVCVAAVAVAASAVPAPKQEYSKVSACTATEALSASLQRAEASSSGRESSRTLEGRRQSCFFRGGKVFFVFVLKICFCGVSRDLSPPFLRFSFFPPPSSSSLSLSHLRRRRDQGERPPNVSPPALDRDLRYLCRQSGGRRRR
jgi:hypothetical protein